MGPDGPAAENEHPLRAAGTCSNVLEEEHGGPTSLIMSITRVSDVTAFARPRHQYYILKRATANDRGVDVLLTMIKDETDTRRKAAAAAMDAASAAQQAKAVAKENGETVIVPALGVNSFENVEIIAGTEVEVEFTPHTTMTAIRIMVSNRTGIRRSLIRLELAVGNGDSHEVLVPDGDNCTIKSLIDFEHCQGHVVVLFMYSAQAPCLRVMRRWHSGATR